jgi:hypothetical protein
MTSPTPREQINTNLAVIARLASETKTFVAQMNDPQGGTVSMTATAGDEQVRLDWVTDRTDITGWTIARDGAGAPAPVELAAGSRSYTFTGLTNGTTYTFTLTPRINLAPETATATPAGTTPPPPPDVTMTATPGDAFVKLDWTVSGEGITGWMISRSGTGAPTPAQLPATARTYTFSGLTNDTAYTFWLTPQTASGNLADETVTATPKAAATATNVAVNPVLATSATEWCCSGTRVSVTGHPKASFAYQLSGNTIFPPKHPSASAGQQWQVSVDCQGDGSVVLGVDWYNGSTYLSNTKSAAVTMSPTGWVTPKVTAIAPANTTRFQVRLDRTGATTSWRATNAFYTTGVTSEPPPPPPPPPTTGRVSTSGRQFFRNGKRWFWMADTSWRLWIKGTREEIVQYLDKRAAQGFNAVQAVAIRPPGGNFNNAYGDPPYSGSLSSPGEAYFQHVDYAVDQARQRGMVVVMLPIWSLNQVGSVLTESNAFGYGQFLANRYASYDNIVWMLGGDDSGSGRETIWRNLANGLDSGANDNIQTFHPAGRSSSTQWFNNEAWIDFHTIQTGAYTTWSTARSLETTAYGNNGGKPWINGEPFYEDHNINWDNSQGWATAIYARRDAYWAVCAGAAGHTYGCWPVVHFARQDGDPYDGVHGPWQNWMDTEGANDMRHVRALFESRPRLEPANSAVTNPGSTGSVDFTPAAKDAANSTLVAYFGNGGSRTINLDVLAGTTAQPWWFDPRTGAATKLGTVASTGTMSFTSPTSGQDWALVIDDVAAGYGAPGVVAPADGQTAAALLNWGTPPP